MHRLWSLDGNANNSLGETPKDILLLKNIYISFNMGRLGFEPRTNRLKAECSTAELATRVEDVSSSTVTKYIR